MSLYNANNWPKVLFYGYICGAKERQALVFYCKDATNANECHGVATYEWNVGLEYITQGQLLRTNLILYTSARMGAVERIWKFIAGHLVFKSLGNISKLRRKGVI